MHTVMMIQCNQLKYLFSFFVYTLLIIRNIIMFTLINFLQQSVRDGFKHNKRANGLKWTTKTAAGTVLK